MRKKKAGHPLRKKSGGGAASRVPRMFMRRQKSPLNLERIMR